MKKLLTTITLLCFSVNTAADNEAKIEEIHNAVSNYYYGFSNFNPTKIANELYSAPFSVVAEDGNHMFDDRPAAHVVQADLVEDRDILLRPQPRAHLFQGRDAVQQRHHMLDMVRRRGLFQTEDQVLQPADVA